MSMTENEAIETHIAECLHRIEVIEGFMHSNSDADKEKCRKNISVLTKIIGLLQEIQAYRAIGTVEEFMALKEKSEPKKAIILDRRCENGDEVCVEWKCPVCGLNVIEEPPCQEYCQRCGTKLDWN